MFASVVFVDRHDLRRPPHPRVAIDGAAPRLPRPVEPTSSMSSRPSTSVAFTSRGPLVPSSARRAAAAGDAHGTAGRSRPRWRRSSSVVATSSSVSAISIVGRPTSSVSPRGSADAARVDLLSLRTLRASQATRPAIACRSRRATILFADFPATAVFHRRAGATGRGDLAAADCFVFFAGVFFAADVFFAVDVFFAAVVFVTQSLSFSQPSSLPCSRADR